MATFTIDIDSSGAAFADDPKGEVARILREVIKHLPEQGDQNDGICRDVNGNRVGTWSADFEVDEINDRAE